MVFDEHNRHCCECGSEGFSRQTCPICPCSYCKAKGHSNSQCPQLQKLWCEDCQKQGHRTGDKSQCPLQKRVNPAGHLSAGYEPSRSKHQRQESDKSSIAHKQPRLQQENVQSQAGAKYESIGSTCEIFPELGGVTRHLIQVLRWTTKPQLRSYKNYVGSFRDPELLCRALLDCIDPQIRELEGKGVTHRLLEEIRRTQEADGEVFDGVGGYLDYLTDDRDDEYCRFYVGQSINMPSRIRSHVVALLRGSVESLHYYIFALGKGSRKSHFLRLFRLSKTRGTSNSDTTLRLSMLEMIMALAFRSLPEELLAEYSRPSKRPAKTQTVHLNVLSPLDQEAWQNGKKRGEERVRLQGSSDPEIRSWPSFRSKQVGRIVSRPSGIPSFREYLPAFNKAIREVFPTIADHNEQKGSIQVKRQTVTTSNLKETLEDFAQGIRKVLGLSFSLDLPLGSLGSELAVVYGISQWNESSPEEKSHNGLPFHLDRAGLTATNSLVWPVDFGSSRQIQLDHIPESNQLYDDLSALTLWMLDKSAARVVLVSGDLAQRYITRRIDNGLSPPLKFELRGQQITFWLDVSEGTTQRVYVDVPDLFKVLSTYTWRLSHQMSLALKLASLIIGLKDLNHRYYENRGALGQIFDTVRTENQGNTIEIAALGDSLRQWLFRRGFENDSEIEELAKVSGTTIGRAIHMLMIFLKDRRARKSPEQRTMKVAGPRNRALVYSTDGRRAVAELFARKEQRLIQKLSGNGKDVEKEIGTHVEDPDLKAPGTFEIAQEEEVLEMLEVENCSGQSIVSGAEEIDHVNTELEPDEPLDEELPLVMSIRPPPQPPSLRKIYEKVYQKVQPETREVLSVGLTKAGAETKWIRSEERVSNMINGGMNLSTRTLRIGGQEMVWNLSEKIANFPKGESRRVWIEFQSPMHTQAWYSDTSEAHLRTFAFKIGMPDETIEQAVYFKPTVQGGVKAPDRADVRAAARSLATYIVRTRYQSHRSS